jgi:ATP synthase protein I
VTARWGAALATLGAGAAVAVVAGFADGGRGVVSALLGALVVLGFFASGIVPLLLVREEDARSKGLATGLLLLTYTFRLAAAVAVLRVVDASTTLSARWLGLSVIAAALAWTTAQVVRGLRRVDPGTGPA